MASGPSISAWPAWGLAPAPTVPLADADSSFSHHLHGLSRRRALTRRRPRPPSFSLASRFWAVAASAAACGRYLRPERRLHVGLRSASDGSIRGLWGRTQQPQSAAQRKRSKKSWYDAKIKKEKPPKQAPEPEQMKAKIEELPEDEDTNRTPLPSLVSALQEACAACLETLAEEEPGLVAARDTSEDRVSKGRVTCLVEHDETQQQHESTRDGGSTVVQPQAARFRLGPFQEGCAAFVSNMFERTLLRQDITDDRSAVAVRICYRWANADAAASTQEQADREVDASYDYSTEPEALELVTDLFAEIPGVKERVSAILENIHKLSLAPLQEEEPALPLRALAGDQSPLPETWYWAARCCGPCAVQARDLKPVDSMTHYERPVSWLDPQQHLCVIPGDVVLEIEVECLESSSLTWDAASNLADYRERRRMDGWIISPSPRFCPVERVESTVIPAEEHSGGEEAEKYISLAVWSSPAHRPGALLAMACQLLEQAAIVTVRKETDAQAVKVETMAIAPKDRARYLALDFDSLPVAAAPRNLDWEDDDGEFLPGEDRNLDEIVAELGSA